MFADVLTQYTFEKVTSASDLVVGDKYAIVCESVTTPVAAGALATDGKSYGKVDVTITDNKIVTTETGITTFTLGGEVDAYTLSPETGKYLGLKAYENSQLVTNVLNDSVRMHIDVDNSGTKIWNAKHSGTETKDNVTTTYYCYYNYNSGQSYFRFYKKGSQKAIVLYKLTKTEQISVGTAITCSFDEAEYSTTIGETFTAPTLNITPNTYDGTVVYESSNEDVATVGTDGAITIVGVGQTTITATAPATDNYQAGEASYTLTIKGAIQDGILNFGMYQDYGSGLSFYGASVKEATWTAGNITMTTAGRSAWQESDGTFRLYAASGNNAAGSITFTSPANNTISQIVFTGSNLDNMSPDTGTLENGTWTGSANSVTFTRSTDSSNPQIKTITVGYASDTAPEAPTFSPVGGTYYGIQQVTVSSATEGATIKVKQSEDGEFETKNSEVTITESKTIWAYAEKDGEKSETVSATYVIGTTETSIAPIITAAEAAGKDGKPVKYTYTPTPINVEYVNGNIAYLHDGTNGIMARSSSNFTWTTGSTIKGYLTGNAELYNGTPSIYVSAIEDETTDSYEPAPTTIEVGQIADNVNKYIKIEGATFVGADSQNNKNLTFKVNDTEFIAYNKFTLDTSNLVADKAYDLVGFGVKFVSGSNAPVYEIYPTAISEKEEETGFRDIKVTLNDASMWQDKINSSGAASTVYITVDAEGNIGTTENAEEAAATLKGYWHGAQYGWQKFSAEVPVEGCVKITLGASNYGSGAVIVTNSNGDQVAKIDNHTGAMWSTSNPDNVAVGYYRTNSPTTLTFSQCDYIPYFAVEAIAEEDLPAEVTVYNVTFAKDADVTGVVPATIEVEDGNNATAPKNTTLYKEGYTLTGWVAEDMTTTYTPGEEITPAADMTLTAVFTENEVSLTDRTEAVTVTWALGEKNGVEGVEYNGTTGIIVTQATVNSNNIDAKLDVDATSAKFTNKNRNDAWAMINANTKLTVPACKNATITVTAYATGYNITAGGNAMTDNGDKTYTYTVTDDVTSIDIIPSAQVYLSHVAVTLPKVEEGGDEPVTSEEIKATWDYSNADVMSETVALSGTSTAGEVNSVEKTLKMTVEANGASFRNNGNNIQVRSGAIFKVPVRTVGDEVTVKGYPNYAQYTVGNVTVNSTGGNGATPDATYKAKVSDVENGYVAITSTNDNNYYYSISVTQYAVTGPTTLDGEEATATFPFNLGTAGQTATFSEGDAGYFLNSKVELGANMGYAATRTLGDYTFTKIQPQTANASAAAEDYVLFRIQPKPGFTFTPSAASLVAYKDGTGNGTLTIAFVTADGTETTLATGQAIARNSETPAYTSLAYNDLSAVTPVEGAVGLKVYIGGNLATNKQVGLSNIIIEGTLSGTEKELPILASFKANDTEYTVDEVFGDLYEADLELSKSESMISESNPLTEITAASGEVGTVIYTNSSETACTVTIPVTAGETTLEYILNITQKPDFTLQYIDVDGTTVLKTQIVEKDATIGTFAQDIADVAASKDGYKARGWFKNNYVGEKWATTDVVTADANLYAVETEIEVASLSKKYVFGLTDKNFDPADHEAFNPTGGKPNVSDMRHGWAFANGNTIDLLVGPKASIIISTCQYPTNGTTKITASNGQSIDAVSATDGATASIEYEGEAGTLTLSFDGTAYIHKLTIFNTTTTNYEKDGDWIIAKAGDASSFLDALDAANGTSGEDPVYIFLPNGTYDLAQTTKTNIGRSNVSIIGESMEGVIIKNRPVKEGIDITATLQNNSENLYMQDLTLDCVAPYGTGDDTSSAERGVTLHDKGTKTILKNVYLKGLQDTYYCNNNDGQYYFEDGKIEGTVDYICGNGDAYFNKVALFNAKRTHGNSGDVIAAPNTPKQYGYIFNECTIDGVDGQDGQYALGRPWASNTQVIFLNTTMKIQPKAEGWSEWSTDVAKQNSVKQFAEYNSVDANGNAIDLTGRKTSFKGVENVPTLNETQAAAFALETVFADWNPAQYTEQVKTTSAKLNGNTLTWSPVDGATMYAIVKNGSIIDLTDQTSYTIADEAQGAKGLGTATEDPTAAGDTYAVRAANGRGGFGEAVVADDATGIDNITTDATGINGTITEVYSMGGARLAAPQKGVNIVKVKANDGSVKTMKVIVK